MVKLLLDNGANVNEQGILNWTTLIQAVRDGYTDVVKVLLEHGADINIEGKWGTALDHAKDGGYNEIVQLLSNYSAKPENE